MIDISAPLYQDQSPQEIRCKCLALIVGTPLAHAARSAARVFDMATGYRYRPSIRCRLWTTYGQDLLKIAAMPALVLSIEAAAFYGLFAPKKGRESVSSIERFAYTSLGMGAFDCFLGDKEPYLAGCFQPLRYSPEADALDHIL
jgi:hypothetical protein